MPPHRPPLPALTGLRFFAALHVVFFHYAPPLPGWVQPVIENGYLAVGLFFVLSGFVLSYTYSGRPLHPRRFWIARLARIYPAYLLAFLLIAPAVAFRHRADPGHLAASGGAALTLVQGWFPSLALSWNGPGWSLSNEAFFYLAFPALLPWLTGLSVRGLWGAGFLACLAAALPPLFYPVESTLYLPLFRLAEFVLGMAAGLLFLRLPESRAAGGPDPLLFAASLGLALYAVFSSLVLPAVLRPAAAAPLFALLVFALARRPSAAARLLSARPLQALGDASYALYILQSPLMAYFLLATRGRGAAGGRTALSGTEFALYTGLLIAASTACFYGLETPSRRWILARAGGGRPEPDARWREAAPAIASSGRS